MAEILNRIIAPDNIISLAVVIGALVLWMGIRKVIDQVNANAAA